MKVYLYSVVMTVVLAFTHCFADSASAQGLPRAQNKAGSESNSLSGGSGSSSSSMSFKKDGMRVSIKENRSGITVTVDGESVRARNVDELKQQHPEAYQLYVEKPGFAIASGGGSASGSGSGSSSSTNGSFPGSLKTTSSKSRNRSVSVIDNGKKINIAENASGIIVEVGEKSIQARNANELKKKSANAFKLYEKHLKKPDAQRQGADPKALLRGNFEARPNASDLLREKLKEMQNEKQVNPRIQDLIQRMLREIDK